MRKIGNDSGIATIARTVMARTKSQAQNLQQKVRIVGGGIAEPAHQRDKAVVADVGALAVLWPDR